MEVLFDAVKFVQSSFCKRPETLNPVDMYAMMNEACFAVFGVLADAQVSVKADIDKTVISRASNQR